MATIRNRISAPAALLAVLALALPARAAAQRGGEAYVTQAGAEAERPQPTRSTDPSVLKGEQVQESLFRNPPLALSPAGLAGTPGVAQGDGNTAIVEQQGSGNTATLTQIGAGNRGEIYQYGNANVTDALQQGNNNLLHLELTGDANEFNLEQRGDDNQYIRAFSGSGAKETVVQEGVGLSVVQVGVGTVPFSIQQRGQGMEIRIDHNGVIVP